MYTLRVVTAQDMQKPAMCRDTDFDTKAAMFAHIRRQGVVSSIRKLPTPGGKLYAVVFKK